MNDQQLIRTLQQAGFKGEGLRTAYAIAHRESGGNPQAFNGNTGTGDQSYGLFQINMLGDLGPSRRGQFGIQDNGQLFDPLTNARAAFHLSKGGTDFGAWGIGPNAYRQGAGMSTIQGWYNRFPGAVGSSPGTPKAPTPPRTLAASKAQAQVGGQTYGGGTVQVDPGFDPQKEWQQGVASFFLARGAAQLAGQAPQGGLQDLVAFRSQLMQRASDDLVQQQALNAQAPHSAMPQVKAKQAPIRVPQSAAQAKVAKQVAGEVQLPVGGSWAGTHVTDNLGWNTKTAEDIMGHPGTPLGAPESGTIEYFHPHGAQGGGSMMFRGDSGREYWIGHVAHGLPGGRVARGQVIAKIANQHVSAPHVHIDWRKT